VFLLLCLGNQILPLIDRDEPRFAEAAREMFQSGDWILPRFNDLPRYDKPPLIYWMQASCYRVFGETAFAARLPAALCIALCAGLTYSWAARLCRKTENASRVGVQAGVMCALSVQMFVHGRAAVADPPMILCFLASAWAGWSWLCHPGWLRCIAFWSLLALGFLSKGPVAWLPLGMVLAALRHPPTGLRPPLLQWGLGAAWMLMLVGLWGIPALVQTRGEFASIGLGKHVIARSVVSMEGHGARHLGGYLLSLPLYFITIFVSFAPWAWWLPAALRDLRKKPSPVTRYLMSGAVLVFFVFTLSRTKLPHYTLPAFPLLAIVLALWWEEARPQNVWNRTALGALGLFLLAPLSFASIRRLSVSENLLAELYPHLSATTQIALVDYEEPSLVWGLRSRITGFPRKIPPADVGTWLRLRPGDFCILSEEASLGLAHTERVAAAEGWNFAKGRRLKLVALTFSEKTAPLPDGK
jgi:4-amino-4-deoxy-L-arabinose transferase-like glycosyltransferase